MFWIYTIFLFSRGRFKNSTFNLILTWLEFFVDADLLSGTSSSSLPASAAAALWSLRAFFKTVFKVVGSMQAYNSGVVSFMTQAFWTQSTTTTPQDVPMKMMSCCWWRSRQETRGGCEGRSAGLPELGASQPEFEMKIKLNIKKVLEKINIETIKNIWKF